MKKETKSYVEEIIRNYGSLEAYNEEQRRCNLVSIENEVRVNPFARRVRLENAGPLQVKVVESKSRPQSRRFWLRLFGQKAH